MNAVRLIKKHLTWMTLAAVFWYFALPAIRAELLDFGGDSAQYIMLAESISKGLGYHMINYPGEPFCFLYPPVFPGILSLVTRFWGRNLYLMSFLISLLGFCGILLIYRLLKQYSSKGIAYLSALSLAVSADYIIYSAKFIRSEVPYIFFSCAGLLFLAGYLKEERWQSHKGWLAAGLITLAYFTRYYGIALIAGALLAVAVSHTSQKAKKIMLISAIFLIPFAAWQTAKFFYAGPKVSQVALLVSGDTTSLAPKMSLQRPLTGFSRLLDNTSFYSGRMASGLIPQLADSSLLTAVWITAVLGLVLWGGWICFLQNRCGIFSQYTILAFFLAAVWPYRDGSRLILPIMGFLLFYFWSGLKDLCRRFDGGRVIFISLAVLILISCSVRALSVDRFFLTSLGPNFQNILKVNRWMKDNLRDQGLVMFCKPDIVSYYTGHKAVVYPLTGDPDDTWAQVKAKKVKYMLADGFSREDRLYLAPFVAKYADRLKLRYASGNCAVFEVSAWSS